MTDLVAACIGLHWLLLRWRARPARMTGRATEETP